MKFFKEAVGTEMQNQFTTNMHFTVFQIKFAKCVHMSQIKKIFFFKSANDSKFVKHFPNYSTFKR